MTNYTPAEVFPPGEFIQEELDARGWTQGDFAAIIGRPIQVVNEIIAAKKAITADTAKAIGDAFGTGPDLWMNLESAWRLSQVDSADESIARRARLYSIAPLKEIVKRGWVRPTGDESELERNILRFMGVSSLDETPCFAAAARMSTSYGAFTPAQVAWLRHAADLAQSVDARPFIKSQFAKDVANIRQLAMNEADVRRIPRFLSELGVRLVLVEKLKGMKLDGAAFWLDESSPVVAISMRYDRIDHLWFVLGHELGHILYGDGQSFVDDELVGEDAADSELSEAERIADQFASELLVPKSELDDFINGIRPLYARNRIIDFANRMGVHPGIVVGQLQHRKEIGFWHSRPLLPKVTESLASAAMSDGWGRRPA